MLTQERLKELLHYCPDTGVFTWRINRGHVPAGRVAGSISDQGYRNVDIEKKKYKAHRLAWLYMYGVMPDGHLDHINRDKLDNRIANLREVTNSQNEQNKVSRRDNTSGYRGVVWHKPTKKWRAEIKIAQKKIHLGLFVNPEDAARAYAAAAAVYHTHNPLAEAAA